MFFFICLSFFSIFRCTFTESIFENENYDLDSSLNSEISFLPLDDSGLPPDDSALPIYDTTLWSVSSDNSALVQSSLSDRNSNILDRTEPVALAAPGVDDFCAANEYNAIIGRMRARGEHKSCPSSDTNVDPLPLWRTLPQILQDWLGVKKDPQPDSSKEGGSPPSMYSTLEEPGCPLGYPDHLCCEASSDIPLQDPISEATYYKFLRGCTLGTRDSDHTHLKDFN